MTKHKGRCFVFSCPVLAILIVSGFVQHSMAEMYKWVDENGVAHFSDMPPQNQERASEVESMPTYDYGPRKLSEPTPSKAAEYEKAEEKETKPAQSPESIVWHEYDEGMNLARSTRKPAIIVFYTTWCPKCKKYWNAFNDTKVMAESAGFIMIRVDEEKCRVEEEVHL